MKVENDIVVGSKFYKYNDEGKLRVIRIIGYKNKDILKYITYKYDDKDVLSKRQTGSISKKALVEDWTMLTPDSYISFQIVGIDNKELGQIEDVVVTMHRFADMNSGRNVPYCVCRQNIINIFSQQIQYHEHDYTMGMTMSIESVPEGVSYNIMTACDKLVHACTVIGYSDDNLEDILRCLSKREMNKFDNVLFDLKQNYINRYVPENMRVDAHLAKVFKGYCQTLKGLLLNTDFMYDYERGFFITKFDEIDMNQAFSTNIEGVYIVREDVLAIIEKAYSRKLYNPEFIKYDRDIQLNELGRSVLLMKDKNLETYVCMYDAEDNQIHPMIAANKWDQIKPLDLNNI